MTMLELHYAWHFRLLEIGADPEDYSVKTNSDVKHFLKGEVVHVKADKPWNCVTFLPPTEQFAEALYMLGIIEDLPRE